MTTVKVAWLRKKAGKAYKEAFDRLEESIRPVWKENNSYEKVLIKL